MAFAYINSAGEVTEIVTKLSPMRRVLPGERILEYVPPNVDLDIYEVSYTTPVLAAFEFQVVAKPGGLEKLLVGQLLQIDQDVDYIYARAIGNRGTEYTQAEKDAQDFASAEFTGTVPPYVASWSLATGWIPQAAAEDILAQATSWRNAAALIREKRLKAKADLRAGVPTALAEWAGFLSFIHSQLGIL